MLVIWKLLHVGLFYISNSYLAVTQTETRWFNDSFSSPSLPGMCDFIPKLGMVHHPSDGRFMAVEHCYDAPPRRSHLNLPSSAPPLMITYSCVVPDVTYILICNFVNCYLSIVICQLLRNFTINISFTKINFCKFQTDVTNVSHITILDIIIDTCYAMTHVIARGQNVKFYFRIRFDKGSSLKLHRSSPL